MNCTDSEAQLAHYQSLTHKRNENFLYLKNQQMKTIENRQHLYQHLYSLEHEMIQIEHYQKRLLNTIKQVNFNRNLLNKEILFSNCAVRDLENSYRKLIKDHKKQQNITNNLQNTS